MNYEDILDQIRSIPAGNAGDDRTITWLNPAQVVGLARNSRGHLELFLAGEELKARTRTVRSSLQYHTWHRENQSVLSANRILLPRLGHFDQVAAFIAAELLRENADAQLERAFAITEPLIELSMKRLEISESAIIGLIGELLVLDALCRRADDGYIGPLVNAWNGWRRSTRDLAWEGIGVEVKTTTHSSSSHAIHGTHQIEPVPTTEESTGETSLLLVSVGLRQASSDVPAYSIPSLVNSILGRLKSAGAYGAIDDFLTRVSSYGSESGIGYEHATMANDAPFSTPFTVTFVRGYNMGDSAIKVLRRQDVVSHQHVDVQSLTFRVDLPSVINRDNPVTGIRQIVDIILGPYH